MAEETVIETPQFETYYEDNWAKNHGGEETGTVYSPSGRSWVDSRTGEKNPRWRAQIAAGHQAGTTMSGYREVYQPQEGYAAITRKYSPAYPAFPKPWSLTAFWATFSSSYTADDPDSLDVTEADNMAKRIFVEKVRKKQTTFQGGIFAAEAYKTITLIRNPAKTLRERLGGYFNSLTRRGGILRREKTPKGRRNALADSWLEASFGWRPLLHDIDSGAQALAESGIIERDTRSPVRALGFSEETSHGPVVQLGQGYPGQYVQHLRRERVEVRYIALVDTGSYSVFNPTRIGFDPSNWLPTVWEVVPWSFLIDYFANIGDIISAASLNTSGVRWTLRTERKITSVETLNLGPKALQSSTVFTDNYAVFRPSRLLHERRSVHRSPYNGDFVPTLEFQIPRTGTQWLNIAALAVSRNLIGRFLNKK